MLTFQIIFTMLGVSSLINTKQMIIIIYFRQKVENILNNNKSKIFLYYYFWNCFFAIIDFHLRTLNTRGSNNVKEPKTDGNNRKGAYICGFHMYPKFFIKFLQILPWQLLGSTVILCLKVFRLSEFFI